MQQQPLAITSTCALLCMIKCCTSIKHSAQFHSEISYTPVRLQAEKSARAILKEVEDAKLAGYDYPISSLIALRQVRACILQSIFLCNSFITFLLPRGKVRLQTSCMSILPKERPAPDL
jgi:hypothetical protein